MSGLKKQYCWNGPNCWYLANGRCWYSHFDTEVNFGGHSNKISLGCEKRRVEAQGIVEERKAREEMRKNADEAIRIAEERKVVYQRKRAEDKRKAAEKKAAGQKKRAEVRKRKADEKRKEKKIVEEKRKAEEKIVADEACSRITSLPGELKIYILHHFSVKFLQRLNLPRSLLRLVLQAEEPNGSQELARSTWLPRLHTNEDRLALFRMAEEADLVPTCPVVKPSLYGHNCATFCPWFAPRGGWDALYEKHYQPESNLSEEENTDGDDEYDFDGFDYYDEEEGFGFDFFVNHHPALLWAVVNAFAF